MEMSFARGKFDLVLRMDVLQILYIRPSRADKSTKQYTCLRIPYQTTQDRTWKVDLPEVSVILVSSQSKMSFLLFRYGFAHTWMIKNVY